MTTISKYICSTFCLLCILYSIIFLTKTINRELQSIYERNYCTIDASGYPQLIPFHLSDFPQREIFSHYFKLYLQVNAPKMTGVILTLRNQDVVDSNTIDICHANADDSCTLAIPTLNNVYAFVTSDSSDFSSHTISWSCFHSGIYLLFLSCVFCCCLCCCFGICSQCLGVSEPNTRASRRLNNQEIVRKVPGTQPFLFDKQFETNEDNDVPYDTKLTTRARNTRSGRFEAVKYIKVTSTDGDSIMLAERLIKYT